MNEIIKDLALKCGAWTQVYENVKGNNDRLFMVNETFNVEKFAELIVRECADIATINAHQWHPPGKFILTHFGVKE